METPDFAFPKTVVKNADADLKSAIKEHDAHAAINALIRLYVANDIIDRESCQKSIETIEKTSEKFADNPLRGIFDALLAKVYNNYYQHNQWIFDRRQLPLTPLPANISEWSGAQFQAQILRLCEKSLDNPTLLNALPLKDYADIVICDKESAPYFPTLLDFACQNAITLTNNVAIDSSDSDFAKIGLKYAATDGANIYWQYVLANVSAYDTSAWHALVEKNASDPLSSILLIGEYNSLPYDSYPEKATFYRQLSDFIDRHPHCPFVKSLTYYHALLAQKSINLSTPSLCSPSIPVKVLITNENAKSFDIGVYRLNDSQSQRSSIYAKDLKSMRPILTTHHTCDKSVPFRCESTADITLDTPGYYAIVASVDSMPDDTWISVTRCVPMLPVALTNVAPSKVLVVNSHSGMPMQGIDVFLQSKKDIRALPATDAMGMCDIDQGILKSNHYWTVELKHQNVSYTFDGVNISRLHEVNAHSRSTARILTDRAIYHPGDEINWMAVAYSSDINEQRDISSSLCTGKRLAIHLYDANNQPVDSIEATTDHLGRAYGKFNAPTEGLTGQFDIRVFDITNSYTKLGQQSVTVSDYKMPDFELTELKTQRNIHGDSTVTISGRAISYAGMPIANTDVTAVVSKASWWRWFTPNEEVYSAKATTDTDGKFTFTMNAGQLHYDDSSPYYLAELSATSPSGAAAKVSSSFSLGPQYIINIGDIGNVDALKPFVPDVNVVSADGTKADITLLWSVKSDSAIVKQGDLGTPIDLSGITPGVYTFVVSPADKKLANEATATMQIYNVNTSIVPGTDPLWLCNDTGTVTPNDNSQVDLLLGTTHDATCVFYFLSDSKTGRLLEADKWVYDKGYHHLMVRADADNDNLQLVLVCVKDCNTRTHTLNIGARNNKSIKIVGESFRDRLMPSACETWKLHLENQDGSPVQGGLALDMYNKALDAIMPHSFALSLQPLIASRTFVSVDFPYNYNGSSHFTWPVSARRGDGLSLPRFQMYQIGYGRYSYATTVNGVAMMKMSRSEVMEDSAETMDMAAAMPVAMAESASDAEEEGAAPDQSNAHATSDFDYRDGDVPLAIWAPALTTDEEGNIVYSFTVPNANTTWRLQAVAWCSNMSTGRLMRDFVANKPVMVTPNVPRFLRAGDQARIAASVVNNTDSVATVTTTIELLNPVTSEVFSSSITTDTLQPMASAVVSIILDAPADANAVCYRVRSSNGNFADGEQDAIRILPSQTQVVETKPFYLNPGDSTYTTLLPDGSDARLTLTFSENPAWTIVSALPGLRQDVGTTANSAAAAILSAAVSNGLVHSNQRIADAIREWTENPSDSTLISMLEKNEDLKLALLNCTPWVQAAQSDNERMANLALIFDSKEIDKSITKAIDQLCKLQNADGGWKWGDWSENSSYWVTGNVLEQLGYIKQLGWLPRDKRLQNAIDKAVKYYDANVYDKKASPDMLYCLIRAYYKDIPVGMKGERTIAATTTDILKHWKSYTDPAQKSMAAMVLYYYKYPTQARKLMSSVSQFGVFTPQQGLTFPSVNSLAQYAVMLEAYSCIEPTDKAVDGLRQQLIVRKQGSDWGSAVVTSQVIASILQSGTVWTVPAAGAHIKAGNTDINPSLPIEKATGTLRADLSAYAGQQLTITVPGTGPAYGAVYAQYARATDSIRAAACDDLSIEKKIAVRRGTEWYYSPDSLAVGDRVKIVLTIHCKRNLDYVTIIDDRAAAFEPVDQVPGWLYSEGVAFYRENRDTFTGLYIDYMAPGTYQLTYEMDVTQAGRFAGGVAAIQSQYSPELAAHSAGASLIIEQ